MCLLDAEFPGKCRSRVPGGANGFHAAKQMRGIFPSRACRPAATGDDDGVVICISHSKGEVPGDRNPRHRLRPVEAEGAAVHASTFGDAACHALSAITCCTPPPPCPARQ